jgi:hypothetical protein
MATIVLRLCNSQRRRPRDPARLHFEQPIGIIYREGFREMKIKKTNTKTTTETAMIEDMVGGEI